MKVEFRFQGKRAKIGQKLVNIRNTVKGKFSKDIVKYGYRKAYDMAPRAKDRLGGGTKEAIRTVDYKNVSKLELVQPIKRPPGKKGYRPYHMWMHGYGAVKIAPYIYTGKPNFMEITFELMREESRKRMDKLLKD